MKRRSELHSLLMLTRIGAQSCAQLLTAESPVASKGIRRPVTDSAEGRDTSRTNGSRGSFGRLMRMKMNKRKAWAKLNCQVNEQDWCQPVNKPNLSTGENGEFGVERYSADTLQGSTKLHTAY
jgi:hypothetical protein